MCGSGRAYLAPAQEALRWERCRQKPPENSPASRPRSTSKASMASTKLVTAPRQTPLQPHPHYGAAVARPSDAIGGPDRDQPHLLCPPTRAARAALWGRTIIWHRRTPDRPRARALLVANNSEPVAFLALGESSTSPVIRIQMITKYHESVIRDCIFGPP